MNSNVSDVRVYTSDDYCGMNNGRHAFYYGYEKTLCPNHGKDPDCECEEREWCFTASHGDEEIARYPASELEATDGLRRYEDPYAYLVAGIGRWLT